MVSGEFFKIKSIRSAKLIISKLKYNNFLIMPAKDIYHDRFKNALIRDGWKITADPYHFSKRRLTLNFSVEMNFCPLNGYVYCIIG